MKLGAEWDDFEGVLVVFVLSSDHLWNILSAIITYSFQAHTYTKIDTQATDYLDALPEAWKCSFPLLGSVKSLRIYKAIPHTQYFY